MEIREAQSSGATCAMPLDVPAANEKDKFSWCHLIFNAFDGDVLFEDVNYPHTHIDHAFPHLFFDYKGGGHV